jgi:hypothetical protein
MVAKKVADKLCNENKMKNKIIFSIRETTKDSKKKTYYYTAIKNKNKIKVVVNKSFVGGVPFPEKFKLKQNNKFLKYNGHQDAFTFTVNIDDACVFFVKEDDFLKNIEGLPVYISGIQTPSLYYKDGKYFINEKDDDVRYMFSVIRYDATYYQLKNNTSKDIFVVVPVVEEAPKQKAVEDPKHVV